MINRGRNFGKQIGGGVAYIYELQASREVQCDWEAKENRALLKMIATFGKQI